MALWTFINEYKGGTYCAQYKAISLHKAVQQYLDKEFPNILKISKTPASDIDFTHYDYEHDYPVALDTLKNIYLYTFLDEKEHMMSIHIVKTETR